MITKITIKNVATYDENGVEINDLKKVNFFFGYNGAGKSTIAKYLYNLSLDESESNSKFSYCSCEGYNEREEQILVFNEEFTKRNFIENDTLKGIFYLNEKNEEIDRKVTELEKILSKNETYISNKMKCINTLETNKKEKNSTLLDDCWKIRDQFKSFVKINLGNNTKKNHYRKIKNLVKNINSF